MSYHLYFTKDPKSAPKPHGHSWRAEKDGRVVAEGWCGGTKREAAAAAQEAISKLEERTAGATSAKEN